MDHLVAGARTMFQLREEIEDVVGAGRIEFIDIGGGLPWEPT